MHKVLQHKAGKVGVHQGPTVPLHLLIKVLKGLKPHPPLDPHQHLHPHIGQYLQLLKELPSHSLWQSRPCNELLLLLIFLSLCLSLASALSCSLGIFSESCGNVDGKDGENDNKNVT